MKKITLLIGFLLFGVSNVSALTCVDLKNNLTYRKNNNEVLLLQNFLMDKGFLTATPNGNFGPSTLAAAKKYQKSVGLPQSGGVLSMTRAAIKKETCTSSSTTTTNTQTVATTTSITTPVSTPKPIVTTPVVTPTITQPAVTQKPSTTITANDKRQNDVVGILGALYAFYLDSGRNLLVPSSTATEICAKGISMCGNLLEVQSSLVPKFLSSVPKDVSVSTATGTGYFVIRSESGDVTVTAPRADNSKYIFATCNFNNKCNISTTVSVVSLAQAKPHINTIDAATFLSGGTRSVPMVIRGSGFTPTDNMVSIVLLNSQRTYDIGNFASTDGKTINATSGFTITPMSCGDNCSILPAPGNYDVIVKNSGGYSNSGYISIKSITTQTTPNSPDVSFRPKSTHMKLASVTLSSTASAVLRSLNFTVTASSTLASKLSNYTLTDVLADKIINSGPNFTFTGPTVSGKTTNQSLIENQTKIYDLYADIADITDGKGGQIYFTGAFTLNDNFATSTVITVPIKPFMISVSY